MSDLVNKIIEVFTKTGRWGRVDENTDPPSEYEVEVLLEGMDRILDEQGESFMEFRGLVMTNNNNEDGSKDVYVYAGTYKGETADA